MKNKRIEQDYFQINDYDMFNPNERLELRMCTLKDLSYNCLEFCLICLPFLFPLMHISYVYSFIFFLSSFLKKYICM